MIEDKINRLKKNNVNIDKIEFIKADFTKDKWTNQILKSSYNKTEISFNSLLGISYYLDKTDFENMIGKISDITCEGSTLLFDFQTDEESTQTKINERLASGANECMKAKYSYQEIETILSLNGFKIYEYLTDCDITNEFFYNYNTLNPNNKIIAPKGVCYLLAVKK